jgi:hypothetical protein
MKADGILGAFYRRQQRSIAGLLLGQRANEAIFALMQLCDKNEIPLGEGVERLLDEYESALRRMDEINSLPLQELLRFPPLELSPKWNGDSNNPKTEQSHQVHLQP